MSKTIDAGKGLVITASAAVGVGCAPAMYTVTGFDTATNGLNHMGDEYRCSFSRMPIVFMSGLTEDGKPNGITIESLLHVCRDRLEAFQAGPFPHPCNEAALQFIDMALLELAIREKEVNRQKSEANTNA